jgi:hypothetical protein
MARPLVDFGTDSSPKSIHQSTCCLSAIIYIDRAVKRFCSKKESFMFYNLPPRVSMSASKLSARSFLRYILV